MSFGSVSSGSESISESWRSDRDGNDAGSGEDVDVSETEAEVDRRRGAESFARRYANQIQENAAALAKAREILNALDGDANPIFSESMSDSNEIRSKEMPPQETTIKDAVKEYMEQVAKADKAKKKSAQRRWLFASAGLMAAAGLAMGIYELFLRLSRDRGASDLNIPEDVQNTVKDLVQKWQSEKDETFWADFADAIDAGLVLNGERTQFTIPDQLVFLNCVIDTNPLKELWVWDENDDALKNAEAIKAFYDKKKAISDIYRNVTSVTYKGKVMPRAVAANQLKSVLGWIVVDRDSKRA